MKRLLLILFGGMALSFAAQAASFDCGKASTKVEKRVCDNPTVSKLDDELSKTYQDDLKKANDEEKQRLITEQKHWLKYTRNLCSDETCFKHAYWSRLAELETFFAPHAPLYKKESDKAEGIKQVLATAPLYLYEDAMDVPFCNQMFDDLKQMKEIYFVDPIVQTQSYEDQALDPWKQQCKSTQPMHFSYACDGKFYSLYKEDIPRLMKDISEECRAGYGLPPFKLFELPSFKPHGKKHYVFYSDDDYGPMNQGWNKPHAGGGSKAGFDKLIFPGCEHRGSSTRIRGGSRNEPNYNSIISYRSQYYLFNLFEEYESYSLTIEPAIQSKPYSICRWTSAKSNASKQGSK